MEGASTDDRSIRETATEVLADYPVRLGLLFGSRGRGEPHESSDIDIAVVFEDSEQSDAEYASVLLGLGADLAVALGTDDIDVVDLRSAPKSIVSAAFDDGTILVGDERDASQLQATLLADDEVSTRSPADRLDDVIADIDDHLA